MLAEAGQKQRTRLKMSGEAWNAIKPRPGRDGRLKKLHNGLKKHIPNTPCRAKPYIPCIFPHLFKIFCLFFSLILPVVYHAKFLPAFVCYYTVWAGVTERGISRMLRCPLFLTYTEN
jgi:hypothetical protein